MNVLAINLVFGTFVFWVAAKIYLLPRLSELRPQTVLIPILLLHGMRHLGLMFLDPGVVYDGIPARFAYPAAIGDFIAAVLALVAIAFVMKGLRGTTLLLWIFNLEGTADLIIAIAVATVLGASEFMGAAFWIPAFWVPLLLVTHYIVFVILIRHSGGELQRAPP